MMDGIQIAEKLDELSREAKRIRNLRESNQIRPEKYRKEKLKLDAKIEVIWEILEHDS